MKLWLCSYMDGSGRHVSEVTQTQKGKCHMCSYICGNQQVSDVELNGQTVEQNNLGDIFK
jgi:hypothetical protein